MSCNLCIPCFFKNTVTPITDISCPIHDMGGFLAVAGMKANVRSIRLSVEEDVEEQVYQERKKSEAREEAAHEGVRLLLAEREAEREYEARELLDMRRCDYGIIDCCCGGCIGEGCDYCAKEAMRKHHLHTGCAAENELDISAVEYHEE